MILKAIVLIHFARLAVFYIWHAYTAHVDYCYNALFSVLSPEFSCRDWSLTFVLFLNP